MQRSGHKQLIRGTVEQSPRPGCLLPVGHLSLLLYQSFLSLFFFWPVFAHAPHFHIPRPSPWNEPVLRFPLGSKVSSDSRREIKSPVGVMFKESRTGECVWLGAEEDDFFPSLDLPRTPCFLHYNNFGSSLPWGFDYWKLSLLSACGLLAWSHF